MSAPLSIELLYQDEHLAAIHKPSGMLVHRSPIAPEPGPVALQATRDLLGQRVYPVHRLDRGTSGLLMFALTPDAARALNQQFTDGTVSKTYLTVVRGHPAEQGLIDHPLARIDDLPEDLLPKATQEPQARRFEAGSLPQQHLPAQTRWQRLATTDMPWAIDRYPTSRYALVQAEPLTGRQHQIRRHFKHIAHPLLGDATYGKGQHNRRAAAELGDIRLMLACTAMVLQHPATGQPLRLTAPLCTRFDAIARGLSLL